MDNPETSDIRFDVGGKTIHAHRVILRLASGYMHQQLDKHWTKDIETVKISDFSYDAYSRYIRFLYTDQLDVVRGEQATDLLVLAKKLEETRLEKKIEEMIHSE